MFHNNYCSISCRFWHIQCQKISRPWNPRDQDHWGGTIR